MAYIVRRERGRYIYLYECRSRRPGPGMNPVTEMIYIGRVDSETRRFISKRYYVTESIDLESGSYERKDLPKVPTCYRPLADFSSS